MMCKLLYNLYGPSTRAAQVLNIFTALCWVFIIASTLLGSVRFDLPSSADDILVSALFINVIIALLGVGAFYLCHQPKRVVKGFALIMGALWQAILANMYVSIYPPMSLMMCVSVVLCLWFTGAVLFIAKCEE